MTENKLHLVLLFEEDVASALEKRSQSMAEHLPGPYVLGVNSLPHMTVIGGKIDYSYEELAARLDQAKIKVPPVDMFGMYFLNEDQDTWFGQSVRPTQELAAFRQNLIDVVQPTYIGNGTNISYFPHATLGRTQQLTTMPPVDMSHPINLMQGLRMTLAFGLSGPESQFQKKLYPC